MLRVNFLSLYSQIDLEVKTRTLRLITTVRRRNIEAHMPRGFFKSKGRVDVCNFSYARVLTMSL